MRFGPTIVGGLVGAAIGVALHLALEVFGGIEAPWFAIIIGLLTGLFVRKFDKSCAGHVSYVRGALAGLIAMGAIVGSSYLLLAVLANSARVAGAQVVTEESEAAGVQGSDGTAVEVAEVEEIAPVIPTRTRPARGGGRIPRGSEFSIMQFAFIAVGIFIAYELGRGTGRAPAPPQASAESPPPAEQAGGSSQG